jgi:hypothetical protein
MLNETAQFASWNFLFQFCPERFGDSSRSEMRSECVEEATLPCVHMMDSWMNRGVDISLTYNGMEKNLLGH